MYGEKWEISVSPVRLSNCTFGARAGEWRRRWAVFIGEVEYLTKQVKIGRVDEGHTAYVGE